MSVIDNRISAGTVAYIVTVLADIANEIEPFVQPPPKYYSAIRALNELSRMKPTKDEVYAKWVTREQNAALKAHIKLVARLRWPKKTKTKIKTKVKRTVTKDGQHD